MRPTARTIKYILTASLMLMSVQLVSAQDAFYIYRNDGDFDGFFYDQVKRMGCSKIDLDGVEHNDYVVQEVETEDSLYRIPLAAIDSIGFQQPDVIFNPRLKNMDELGISEYVEYFGHDAEESYVYLRADIPENLIPKVDDVIVSFGNPIYKMETELLDGEDDHEHFGFGGKVRSITKVDGLWLIRTDHLRDLSDVFVQLVGVEQVGYDEQGNVKRRLAGFDYDEQNRKWIRKAKTGGGSVDLIDFSQTLHVDKELGNNGSASLELGLGMKMGLQMAYNISWKRIFFKLSRDMDMEVGMSANLKTSTSFEAEVTGLPGPLNKILFPAVAPLFQTKPLPYAFLRGGGELAAKLKSPTFSFGYSEAIIFDSDFDYVPFRYTCSKKGSDSGEAEKSDLFSSGDVELSFSGFLQAGLKFSANVSTNDWAEKIFHSLIALDVYVGPKIEGSVSLSTAKLVGSGAYDALKGSSVKLHAISADLSAHAGVKMFWGSPKYMNFLDASANYGTVEWKLFPSFKDYQAKYDSRNELIEASIYPADKTFFPSTLCIGLYNSKDERIQQYEHPKHYFLTESIKEVKTTFSTTNIPCGRYIVRPYLKVAGIEVFVPLGIPVDVTPVIKLNERTLETDGKSTKKEISFVTNAETVTAKILDENGNVVSSNSDKITATVSNVNPAQRSGKLTVDLSDNHTFWNQKNYVVVEAKSGEFVSTDTLTVKQDALEDTFTNISGRVSIPALYKKSSRLWGDRTNEYDGESEDYLTVNYITKDDSKPIPFTCERNGDTIVIHGQLTIPNDDSSSNYYRPNDEYIDYNSFYCEGAKIIEWELVVDVSQKPGYLVGGYWLCTNDHNLERIEQHTKITDELNYLDYDYHFTESFHYKEYLTWKHRIPGNLYDDHINFGLGNFCMDQSDGILERSYYRNESEMYYDEQGKVLHEYRKNSHQEESTLDESITPIVDDERKSSVSITLYF